MPLRRTRRSDDRLRSRWKDGSHVHVENTNAEQSQHRVIADGATREPEPFVNVSPLLRRDHESHELTRGHPGSAGADARIEESGANGEIRLALLPYGRKNNAPLRRGVGYRSGGHRRWWGWSAPRRGPNVRPVDAREAERIGLVSRVLPEDQLVDHAIEVAESMCELSPYGLSMTKRVCWDNLEVASLHAAIDLEDRNQLLLGNTENLIECIAARRENRKPVYTDKPRTDLDDYTREH
jgi:hypothetical protein